MFLVIVVNVKYTFSKDCCDYFIRMGCERSEEWNQGELLRKTTVVQVTADGHLGLRECWWRWRERTGASCWPGGCDREEGGVSVSLGVGVLNIHESRAIIHHSSLSFTGYEPLKVWLLLKSNFFREPFPGTTICSIVVQSLSCVRLSVIPWTAASQPPCPSLSPKISSNSSSTSQWCSPTISSSVFPFSSCLQSFLASGSFPMNQFFTSGGQSIGASASASVLPMDVSFMTDWFDVLAVQGTLKGLLQHHSSKASILWHSFSLLYGPTFTPIYDYWKNHSFDCMNTGQQSDISAF